MVKNNENRIRRFSNLVKLMWNCEKPLFNLIKLFTNNFLCLVNYFRKFYSFQYSKSFKILWNSKVSFQIIEGYKVQLKAIENN